MPNPSNANDRAHIFCIANQKGGVGKTTTAINLAAGLATQGQRVLLVDLDPQGNATMGSGIDKSTLAHNLYQVLIGEASVKDAAVRSESGGYDVLPANRELSGAEIDLVVERGDRRIGYEFKCASSASRSDAAGLQIGLADGVISSGTVVHCGSRRYPLADNIEAVPAEALMTGWK